jgi:hypothetical protein
VYWRLSGHHNLVIELPHELEAMVLSEEDEALAAVLDRVDTHSTAREKLQDALSDGYMALAREQISDYSSHLRK